MSNKISKVLTVLAMLLVASCSSSLDVQLDPEVNAYISQEDGKKIRLTANDKAYAALSQWLDEHRSGWYSTSGRYPGGVYIKSADYGIQVTETHVILYSTTSSEPRALYIQQADPNELREVRALR